MILNDARGWAKATLPTYQDRKEFFEGIVNGDPDPVELVREGREREVLELIEAAKRDTPTVAAAAGLAGDGPLAIYVVVARGPARALDRRSDLNRYYATRKCHLCGAQVELGRSTLPGLHLPVHQLGRTGWSCRRLGDSELEVSEISLGSWLTYSGGVEREHTEACTRAAFDAGINFFDTANVYGTGAAEEAWGEILSGYDRDSYVLATKVYFPMSETDSRPLGGADPQADRRLAARGCRPTTSTSTSATASTPRRRSRRRWRR